MLPKAVGAAIAAAALALGAWLVGPGTGGDPVQPSSGAPASSSVSSSVDPESGLRWIGVADLPPEALRTLQLVSAGGPYPYDRDGVTFENREGLLPAQPLGYYREFTVPTPGSDDRGARRVIVGAGGEEYYTEDHYDSFYRIGP